MQQPDSQILVIFGASGDLTQRKLIPAIYSLYNHSLLPQKFAILGVGRKSYTDETFRDKMEKGAGIKEQDFLNILHYISINTKDSESYAGLNQKLTKLNNEIGANENYIYYFATPPYLYSIIAKSLEQYGLNKHSDEKTGWKRVIAEKPFGYDLESARKLNNDLLTHFLEHQIYRIDHYLGKETVQNIMVTRFSNNIFEPLWNRNYIDHVQITSAEQIGIEKRGEYYDSSGALRDMVQNHLMQLIGMIAMEPPALASSEAIRNETLKVYQSLRPYSREDIDKYVIKGQYSSSTHGGGQRIPGYKEEEGIPKDSNTETFAALKLNIDNWRWKDVPFFIRTGKRMPRRATEIIIQFKPTPHHIFCLQKFATNNPNQLIIRIQPDEGIMLRFGMKIPGSGFNVQNVNMNFHYSDLSQNKKPEAYERLLLDCMLGDPTLYLRGDAVEKTWEFITPILKAWEHDGQPAYEYPAGAWGPEKADQLIRSETGFDWRNPCYHIEKEDNENDCR